VDCLCITRAGNHEKPTNDRKYLAVGAIAMLMVPLTACRESQNASQTAQVGSATDVSNPAQQEGFGSNFGSQRSTSPESKPGSLLHAAADSIRRGAADLRVCDAFCDSRHAVSGTSAWRSAADRQILSYH